MLSRQTLPNSPVPKVIRQTDYMTLMHFLTEPKYLFVDAYARAELTILMRITLLINWTTFHVDKTFWLQNIRLENFSALDVLQLMNQCR